MRRTRRTFLGIIAICLVPLAIALIGMALAGALGCEISDSFTPEPCRVFGLDIAGLLSPLVFSGWFGLFTLPLVALALATWAALEGLSKWRQQRRARKASRPAEI